MAVSGQHWLEEGPLCELLLVANEPQEKQGKSMQKPSLAVLSSVFLFADKIVLLKGICLGLEFRRL